MMINHTKLIGTIVLGILMVTSHSVQARNCGKVLGNEIKAYGTLSCSQAKTVYKAFIDGKTPKGWTCGQSVGGCGKGEMGFTFKTIR